MSWSTAKQSAERQMSGGLFVRLKDGDSITGVVDDDVVERRTHWIANSVYRCRGKGCAECSAEKPRVSFAFLMFDVDAANWRIVELSRTAFLEVAELEDELPTHVVTIKRTGSAMHDTRYRARSKGEIDDGIRSRMSAAEKPDARRMLVDEVPLTEERGASAKHTTVSGDAFSDDDLPF